MGSNIISDDTVITPSLLCIYDSNIAYFSDFSVNGEVDGWTYYDGIHTYGVWDGFLFGTMYSAYGVVGRHDIFRPVNATTHYMLRIVMKYNPVEREGIHVLPTRSKIRWRTLDSTNWDGEKEKFFDLKADNKWNVYTLNLGTEKYWKGDVNDLRIWVAVDSAQDGDEFFIRTIEIFSAESFECTNTACEKYPTYSNPCTGVGERGYCESSTHYKNKLFTIDNGTEFIININNYGDEIIKVYEVLNKSGQIIANKLARSISRIDVGGYAEVHVEYTEDNKFIIYSGTAADDSVVEVIDNDLSRYLNFFDDTGNDVSVKGTGVTPANGYSPLSSFKIKTHQVLSLFDDEKKADLHFEPFIYNVEAGRRDWLESGPGAGRASKDGWNNRSFQLIFNNGKTIVDFNHPFNASGRIKKIYAACTLDMVFEQFTYNERMRIPNDQYDKDLQELSGAKVMIFRPRRNGTLDVIYEFDINSRDPDRGYYDKLYSSVQDVIELDVDVFVNKGDLLGIYNANLFIGKNSRLEKDCQYFQINGKQSGNFVPGNLNGDGIAGILMYARGDDTQRRLVLDIDLKHRYNIENIEVEGRSESNLLEYNIARCLDINWEVELFNEYHWTCHKYTVYPGEFRYQRFNAAFGVDNLNDGILTVPDGIACDSYSLTHDAAGAGQYYTYNAGPGVVPINPKYFWVNGDEEWLAVWLHASVYQYAQETYDFEEDQIAIFLHFPHQKKKTIYRSKIYFKEPYNFRSFALSTYRGYNDSAGNADDAHYDLIPAYNVITLDKSRAEVGSEAYYRINEYLFKNPCDGFMRTEPTSEAWHDWDPVLSDVVRDYSGEEGYFTTQNYRVTNETDWLQSMNTDWRIIEHEWDPISCKGFRIFTNYHKSTKICEMELYGVAQDIGSSFAGGIVTNYSDYLDVWWPTESIQINESLTDIYIGDTPRYITIQFAPIGVTTYDNITLYVKTEDTYAGPKGCEYIKYLEHSKLGANNESELVEFKNDYGKKYDLLVDIATNNLINKNFIFYSKLDSEESILNPEIGPDAYYTKKYDYEIRNDNYNCAINCDVYGLHNLIDGKKSYYLHNKSLQWDYFGELISGNKIDFHNLQTTNSTFINLPILSKNRYWKFGFKSVDPSMKVREARFYNSNGEQYLNKPIYHDLNKTYIEADVSYRAPHLENVSIIGSYYELAEDQYITVDLENTNEVLGSIELIHDGIADYTLRTPGEPDSDIIVGIDKYTKLCLRPWVDTTGGHLDDLSYYEHPVSMHGTAQVIDSFSVASSIEYDVSFNCLTDWADWFIVDNYVENTPTFDPGTPSTVISGTCISGSGYFDFDLACSSRSGDGLFYSLKENYMTWPLWQNVSFEVKFKIRFDSTVKQTEQNGTTSVHTACGVGIFADKVLMPLYSAGVQYVPGAQMVFEPGTGKVGIAVKRYETESIKVTDDEDSKDYTYQSVLSLGIDYYCKFSSNGSSLCRDNENITYYAEVWTDTWDGAQKVADISLISPITWDTYKVGLSSCYGADLDYDYGAYDFLEPGYIRGIISDFQLTINHEVVNYPFDKDVVGNTNAASLRLPLGESNYAFVPTHDELDFGKRRHTIDFWVKFNTLPENAGDFFTLLEGITSTDGNCWSIRLHNTGVWYRLEWWVHDGTGDHLVEWNGQVDPEGYISNCNFMTKRWYYLLFSTGKSGTFQGFERYSFFDINGRAIYDNTYAYGGTNIYDIFDGGNVRIGKKFDGWISEIRISRGNNDTINTSYGYGGSRINHTSTSPATVPLTYGERLPVPVKPYEKLYTFSIYVSDNNEWFGHYIDVDSMFDDSYSYFVSGSIFAEKYNSYFAIDLNKRHCLDIIRHYGANNLYDFTIDTNMIFSDVNTDDPNEAFFTEFMLDPNDSFLGWDSEIPDSDKWVISEMDGDPSNYLRLRNGYLESKADINNVSHNFRTKYSIQGDFDIEVRWGRTATSPDINYWCSIFRADLPDSSAGRNYVEIKVEYDYDNPSPYYYIHAIFGDNGVVYDYIIPLGEVDNSGMRIVRHGTFFTCYYYNSGWVYLTDYTIHKSVDRDVSYIMMGTTIGGENPTVINYYKNFKVNNVDKLLIRSDYKDARWVAIELLNGDGVDRYIEKIGIYPDLTKSIIPGGNGYNCDWDNLGNSITRYSDNRNLALGTTVSGSSYVDGYPPENCVDGLKGEEFIDAWITNNSNQQWLLVDLGEEKEIYRVKLYHGFSELNENYMITGYEIQISTDNQVFTTIFDINGNNLFERTHDLLQPVTARYVRLYITDYISELRDLRVDGTTYIRFEGAVLREIEVYEASNFSTISSEEYPIVAINLRDQFYIKEHSLLGVYAESSWCDWSNDDSNFAYSDDVCNEPQKVVFSEFGVIPNYEQWVIVKRNTATYYNVFPELDVTPAGDYGIDYLKHVVIKSIEKQNPIDYYWWWDSMISTLSNSYDKSIELSERSLRVDYPASTALDEVSFSRGSTDFGVDRNVAYRDGVGFNWYIDDVSKLDMNSGYFYFGGVDGTGEANDVEFRWYLSTFSGTLQSGLNRPYFRFKFADEIIGTYPDAENEAIHPLMLEYMTIDKMGIKFKGFGQSFGMNVDGFVIKRNHFNDASIFGSGFYLEGDDFLTFPLGEMSLSSGTIEFWLRPDYNFFGTDVYGRCRNRSLFSFSNVANDLFGVVITKEGLVFYFGNLVDDLNLFTIDGLPVDSVDKLYHIAVVFSNTGLYLGTDNSTIRLYINNFLISTIYETWEVSDNKFFKFIFGGKAPGVILQQSYATDITSIDGVVSELKLYNYCKTDFADSLAGRPSREQIVDVILPSELISISSDNVTFSKVGDVNLPFLFEEVDPGVSVPIYVKSVVPSNITGYEKRTSGLMYSWRVGV